MPERNGGMEGIGGQRLDGLAENNGRGQQSKERKAQAEAGHSLKIAEVGIISTRRGCVPTSIQGLQVLSFVNSRLTIEMQPMHWQSGDKVYLKHTGRWATIARLIGQDMAMVRLPGDPDEIPVHLDDCDFEAPHTSTDAHSAVDDPMERGSFGRLDEGVFLAISLDPASQSDRKAYLFLVNDWNKDLQFETTLRLPRTNDRIRQGQLASGGWAFLFEFPMDQLNDHPDLAIKLWVTGGIRQVALPEFDTRLKAKPVVTRQQENPYLAFHAALFEIPTHRSDAGTIPLKTVRPPHTPPPGKRVTPVPAPADKATFETILDLHAEALFKDPRKYSEVEIFQKQLMKFDQYIEKAIRLGVPKVFVIHGMGKGKLRDAILERSRSHPEVIRAFNEYHPLFGFGATEIDFVDEF